MDTTMRQAAAPAASLTGAVLGLLFYAEALRPSLLPRDTVTQILLGALAAATGYALGALAGSLVRRAIPATDRRFSPPVRAGGATAVAMVALGVTLARLPWQADQRDALGVSGAAPGVVPTLLGVALATLLLILIGRAIRRLVDRLAERLQRHMPVAAASVLGWIVLAAAVLLIVVLLMLGLRAFFNWSDGRISDDETPPAASTRSGSPPSLVAWEDLGKDGRTFVTGGPSPAELTEFAGAEAVEPVRAFVGVASADNPQARAELLVEELERSGGFDREAVVLFTPSGSGYVNPTAVATVEYLYGGDVASGAMQYSTLPSFLSFVVDGKAAGDSSTAALDAVRAAIDTRPEGSRPRLFVYGESLGALGSDAPFAGGGPQGLVGRVDGALWIGPPASSAFRAELMDDAAGPTWQPVVDDGSIVRFGAAAEALNELESGWGPPRAAYVQHSTDPVVWFAPSLLWRPPGWLDEPRGPGVDDRMAWRPLVTFEQVLLDLPAAGGMPDGVGHRYTSAIPRAWALLAAPAGWTDADTGRLVTAVTADG